MPARGGLAASPSPRFTLRVTGSCCLPRLLASVSCTGLSGRRGRGTVRRVCWVACRACRLIAPRAESRDNHEVSSSRRVIVVPGRNMGPFAPQLLFPTFAAIRRGAEPTAVEWGDVEAVDGLDSSKVPAWVAAQIETVFADLDPESTVVIGKSLGTHAAAAAARSALPAIWVTPLLSNTSVLDALRRSTAPFLLVGGTADPVWDGAAARALTPHVLELPDADHGLFVPGPLAKSVQNISALATGAERFLDENVWPAGERSDGDS